MRTARPKALKTLSVWWRTSASRSRCSRTHIGSATQVIEDKRSEVDERLVVLLAADEQNLTLRPSPCYAMSLMITVTLKLYRIPVAHSRKGKKRQRKE
jgi:hypothetical protein